MAAFDYSALDANGRRARGVLEAESARHARQLLRARALTPLALHEADSRTRQRQGTSAPRRRSGGKAVGLREVSMLTRQLATLIAARLPVEQALQVVSQQQEKPAIERMIAAVRTQVLEGNTLADSMAAYPRAFSELYRASIHAGERSSHLDTVLSYLADYTESSYQARQKMLLALLYPMILTIVSLAIIFFLLVFIVPDMVRVFSDAGQTLPLLTRGLIAISHGIGQYGLLIVAAAVMLVVWLRRRWRKPTTRAAIDRRMLRWPVVGKLLMQYNLARFSATLGMLHESGVPLVQALDIASATLGNRHIKTALTEVAKRVSEGVSLAQSLEQTGIIPPVLTTMVASGEASGTLGEMLARASAIQQRDLENRTALVLGLFEPLVLVFMGGVVLLLVLAIILPILNLNQLVS